VCIESPSERPRRTSVTLVIKLIILLVVLAFGLAVLMIGMEAAGAGLFVSVVVGVGVKAGSRLVSDPDRSGRRRGVIGGAA
jgi:hypothetical protein